MRMSWEEIFSGSVANEAHACSSLRRYVFKRMRAYPPRLFRGTGNWEPEELKTMTEEFLSQFAPTLRLMTFSEAPAGNIFRVLRNEISDFMLAGSPKGTRRFVNQLSGALKPVNGFRRNPTRGIGLLEWPPDFPLTSYSRNDLLHLWKSEFAAKRKSPSREPTSGDLRSPRWPSQPGTRTRAKSLQRRETLRSMLLTARGWVPKSWLYNGFLEISGEPIDLEVPTSPELMEPASIARPSHFQDIIGIREAIIHHQDSWTPFLEKLLRRFTGKARVIVLRLLLYEETQVQAAKRAGTSSQYAGKILQSLSQAFSELLPLEHLEMTAFKSFLQEHLDRLEKTGWQ